MTRVKVGEEGEGSGGLGGEGAGRERWEGWRDQGMVEDGDVDVWWYQLI